jgi:hypothetical protein
MSSRVRAVKIRIHSGTAPSWSIVQRGKLGNRKNSLLAFSVDSPPRDSENNYQVFNQKNLVTCICLRFQR